MKGERRLVVGISGAYCAIAETGTLMTLSGESTPASTSLLPETHIAILSVARIVRGMDAARVSSCRTCRWLPPASRTPRCRA